MAIYHLSVKAISRSAGRSATAAAAYRAGCEITDSRTGNIFDYKRRGGVESADLVLPVGAAEWAIDRAKLWNAAELAEKRKDACVAREFEVALPSELSPAERRRLALDFARDMASSEGCAVDVAIHAPGRGGDNRNHHAHILRTTRKVGADGFGEKLDTEKAGRKRADDLEAIRARWADMTNERLCENGIAASVDHRSLEEQGIDRDPTQHLGVAATGFERRTGETSRLRLAFEQEARARLAAAREAYELARAGQQAGASIIDLTSQLSDLIRERDTKTPEQLEDEKRIRLDIPLVRAHPVQNNEIMAAFVRAGFDVKGNKIMVPWRESDTAIFAVRDADANTRSALDRLDICSPVLVRADFEDAPHLIASLRAAEVLSHRDEITRHGYLMSAVRTENTLFRRHSGHEVGTPFEQIEVMREEKRLLAEREARRVARDVKTTAQRLDAFIAESRMVHGEGMDPLSALHNLRAGREISPDAPGAFLGEEERQRLRKHELIDASDHITPVGEAVLVAQEQAEWFAGQRQAELAKYQDERQLTQWAAERQAEQAERLGLAVNREKLATAQIAGAVEREKAVPAAPAPTEEVGMIIPDPDAELDITQSRQQSRDRGRDDGVGR